MKIFLSWSGNASQEIAKALREWIPAVIQRVEAYVSSEDIRKGARWAFEIATELEGSFFGILCIVPGNSNAPWVHFEAGALSKSLKQSHVIPLLIGVGRDELAGGPLAQFQSALFEKEEMLKVLFSINKAIEPSHLPEKKLEQIFEVWWPDIDKKVGNILKSIDMATPEKKKVVKTPDDIDDIEIGILQLFGGLDHGQTLIARDVASSVSIGIQKAVYYLDRLCKQDYLYDLLFANENPTEYGLNDRGREYLVKNDLI